MKKGRNTYNLKNMSRADKIKLGIVKDNSGIEKSKKKVTSTEKEFKKG